ncbi:ABC transporter permease [Dactylosporangium sp. NBC_01737]|uniref:ABC transporter permease n=1 Tax=Dactylosporangium sp. NBC_01737 TaxID=2975959 RepID=UPI002E13C3C2|nr:ABC transporter permease [Dactylosporangium sp. NBC_01737]
MAVTPGDPPHIPAQRPADLPAAVVPSQVAAHDGGAGIFAPRPEPIRGGEPRVGYFVRLKLRILRNTMRGKKSRIWLFILGVFFGLWAAFIGFGMFAGSSVVDDDLRPTLAAFCGTALVLAWILIPLLFFGVDETLDPARFSLLPVPRRTLVLGMLAAAVVGIPPAVTLLAALGSTVGAIITGGVAAGVVAVFGAVVGLAVCVAASRAVTSAFAGMLRSRKVRDLAALLIALAGISCNPIFQLVFALVENGESKQATTIAGVLSWTPFAAPFVAYVDAIDGNWHLVAARLAIGVAGVAALLWWWLQTIESAMLGTASSGAAKKAKAVDGKPVRAFLPGILRSLPAGRFTGLVGREVRYWFRDPRRRASLISLLAASVVIPFAFTFGFGTGSSSDEQEAARQSAGMSDGALVFSLLIAGAFVGLVLVNQFGNDGTAYALHMLTNVPGQVELAARAIGVGILTFPLLAVGTVAVSVLSGHTDQLPAALGVGLCAFGISVGAAGITSVLAPYPMPDSANPFAMNTGQGSAKSMLSFVTMFATWALASPVMIAFVLLPDGLIWLLLPVGIGWGFTLAWVGTRIAGNLLVRRAPEVLAAVTPKLG